jgi:hypothetical protein
MGESSATPSAMHTAAWLGKRPLRAASASAMTAAMSGRRVSDRRAARSDRLCGASPAGEGGGSGSPYLKGRRVGIPVLNY